MCNLGELQMKLRELQRIMGKVEELQRIMGHFILTATKDYI